MNIPMIKPNPQIDLVQWMYISLFIQFLDIFIILICVKTYIVFNLKILSILLFRHRKSEYFTQTLHCLPCMRRRVKLPGACRR